MEKVFSPEELFTPDNPEIETYAEEVRKRFEPVLEKLYKMTSMKQNVIEEQAGIKEEERSRILVMAGSGTAVMQVSDARMSAVPVSCSGRSENPNFMHSNPDRAKAMTLKLILVAS